MIMIHYLLHSCFPQSSGTSSDTTGIFFLLRKGSTVLPKRDPHCSHYYKHHLIMLKSQREKCIEEKELGELLG